MDAIEAIHGRRSIRDYQARAVPRAVIEAIIRDAVQAPYTPTSVPEPWVFNVIEGRDRIEGYGGRALKHARRHRPQLDGYRWADKPDFSVFHGAPAVIIISGRAHDPLALEECTRAGQILVIAAHARGLGACWVGSPNLWLTDPAVRAELAIPIGFAPGAVFVLGYAASVPPPPMAIEPRTIWLPVAGRATVASPRSVSS